jgi:hypothetical protein
MNDPQPREQVSFLVFSASLRIGLNLTYLHSALRCF